MKKHYNYLDIDLDSSKIYRKLSAMQGDIKSRYILVNLYSNNLAYDLTNCNVKIYGIKKDTTVFFNNAVIIDALKGQFEIELTNQALAVSGELKIQILILGATGEKLTSSAFFINVGESIVDENAIESTNEFNALTEGLAGLVEYDIYKQNVSAHEEKLIQHDAQFNTMGNETRSKRIQGENTKDDTKGPFDSANFAGQDLGVNAPIGNVMHHYTDGITFQVDNVGENNKILVLKNAYNPSRRPDKAADFVGSGDFLTCLQGVIGDLSKKLFTIGKDGNLYWFDKDDTVILGSNKEDDNTPLAKIIAYKPHKYIFQLVNDNSGLELSIGHIENKVQIESGNYATKGMKLKANLGVLDLDSEGDLNLNPKTKRINIHGVPYIYEGTNYNRCVTIRIGASAGRPTSELYAGMMYLDTSLGSNGKPIWYNGTNWVDANGVVV